MVFGSPANSINVCRHIPHGDDGGDVSVTTATDSIACAPSRTARRTALRSAQTARPYDAFSTLAPSSCMTSPSSPTTAAPT